MNNHERRRPAEIEDLKGALVPMAIFIAVTWGGAALIIYALGGGK